MSYWVQHIAKLLTRNAKKLNIEDIQQIRYASSKLLTVVQQSGKLHVEGFELLCKGNLFLFYISA